MLFFYNVILYNIKGGDYMQIKHIFYIKLLKHILTNK